MRHTPTINRFFQIIDRTTVPMNHPVPHLARLSAHNCRAPTRELQVLDLEKHWARRENRPRGRSLKPWAAPFARIPAQMAGGSSMRGSTSVTVGDSSLLDHVATTSPLARPASPVRPWPIVPAAGNEAPSCRATSRWRAGVEDEAGPSGPNDSCSARRPEGPPSRSRWTKWISTTN